MRIVKMAKMAKNKQAQSICAYKRLHDTSNILSTKEKWKEGYK